MRKLDRLQYQMHAEKKHSLLIVLQGMDACGKDGMIRHLLTGMNPAGCRVVGFKRPKPEELDHDFLWRVHPHLPAKGEVTIFNRSHYEDVLVVRVHQFAEVNMWSKRYELINDFERLLAMENDTTVLKFFLYISKEEQLVRFKQRLDDPARRWKNQRSRLPGAGALEPVHGSVRGYAAKDQHAVCAVVCDSVEQQVVPGSGGVADRDRYAREAGDEVAGTGGGPVGHSEAVSCRHESDAPPGLTYSDPTALGRCM